MSIATDMANEWLATVASPPQGDHLERNARRAELLGAGTHVVSQLLAEIERLQKLVGVGSAAAAAYEREHGGEE